MSGADTVQDGPASRRTRQPRVPKPKPIGVMVRLTPKQHDALRRVATEQDVTISNLVRNAIADVLMKHGK